MVANQGDIVVAADVGLKTFENKELGNLFRVPPPVVEGVGMDMSGNGHCLVKLIDWFQTVLAPSGCRHKVK